jgi:hypothetical protein
MLSKPALHSRKDEDSIVVIVRGILQVCAVCAPRPQVPRPQNLPVKSLSSLTASSALLCHPSWPQPPPIFVSPAFAQSSLLQCWTVDQEVMDGFFTVLKLLTGGTRGFCNMMKMLVKWLMSRVQLKQEGWMTTWRFGYQLEMEPLLSVRGFGSSLDVLLSCSQIYALEFCHIQNSWALRSQHFGLSLLSPVYINLMSPGVNGLMAV